MMEEKNFEEVNFDSLVRYALHTRSPEYDWEPSKVIFNGKKKRSLENAVGFKILEGDYKGIYFRIDAIKINVKDIDGGMEISIDYTVIQNRKLIKVSDNSDFDELVTKIVMDALMLGNVREHKVYADECVKEDALEETQHFRDLMGVHKTFLNAFEFAIEDSVIDNDVADAGVAATLVKPKQSLIDKDTKFFKSDGDIKPREKLW
jgi:hypothetical protein